MARQRYREILARIFRQAARSDEIDLASVGLSASETADLFHKATIGLMEPGVTIEAYRRGLRILTTLWVAGLGASIAAPRRRTARVEDLRARSSARG